jgi:transposase
MARYKPYDLKQGKMIALSYADQIVPGSFEYALDDIVENHLDLSIFDKRYRNDRTGRLAYDPKVMLKIVLYGYYKGLISSRDLEEACRRNVVFMALSADTRPHFTTIAEFISSTDREIIRLFLKVLMTCHEMGLIGKEMFTVDGCKMPSNASKEWSGTIEELTKKKEKMEKLLRHIMNRHLEMDKKEKDGELVEQETKYMKTLRKKIHKVKKFLEDSEDKPGKRGKPVKSNITDNESAKMKTSHGVIQGYNGVAVVDSRHQVIVHAEAFGAAQEHDLLIPMIEGTKENFEELGDKNVFEKAKLVADSGYHTEENMKMVMGEGIDAYIADPNFRKRDPRFAEVDKYKERARKERKDYFGAPDLFRPNRDFTISEDKRFCICPAGKRLHRNGGNVIINGQPAIKFRGNKTDCRGCELRQKCLRNPERSEVRQVHFFHGATTKPKTFSAMMRGKIDSITGRLIYNRRLGIAEPPFANIKSAIGLDRFTLRGQRKTGTQWRLFCIVHNVKKIHRYAEGFT